MASQNINLFQTKTTLQPILLLAQQYIKLAATITLSIVFVGGILLVLAFFLFGKQQEDLLSERDQLLQLVKQQVAKESTFMMVRNRLVSVQAIRKSQIDYAPFIDTTIKIIQSFPLASFSLGEKNSVTISVKVSSLEEATNVFVTLMDMERKKEITLPMMHSLSMNENSIQIGLSFIVVL